MTFAVYCVGILVAIVAVGTFEVLVWALAIELGHRRRRRMVEDRRRARGGIIDFTRDF